MTADTIADNEFRKLANLYGAAPESGDGGPDAKLIASPLYFVRGGYVASGLDNAGHYGFYWSSAAYNSTQAHYLGFNSTVVGSANGYLRYFGRSVRCVAQ